MTPGDITFTRTRPGVRVCRVPSGWWRIESPAHHGIPTIHRVYTPTGVLEHVARTYAAAITYVTRAILDGLTDTDPVRVQFQGDTPELPKGN